MSQLLPSLAWGLAIGGSLLAGALAASLPVPARAAAAVTAFGGGIMFAAVAIELVPEANGEAGTVLTALGLLAGSVLYVAADAALSRDPGTRSLRRAAHAAGSGRPVRVSRGDAEAARGESIAAGIFVDGVPESVALGLTVAEGELGVALLAGILVGNVTEAYGAGQPMIAHGRTPRFVVGVLGAIGLALAGATVLGGTVLADASPALVGTAQAVAAGAVLAVVTIAITPHAFAEVNRQAAIVTVLGFIAGYLLS